MRVFLDTNIVMEFLTQRTHYVAPACDTIIICSPEDFAKAQMEE